MLQPARFRVFGRGRMLVAGPGCSAGQAAIAAGMRDQRPDRGLVDHAGMVADVNRVMCPVKLHMGDVRAGPEHALYRIGTAGTVDAFECEGGLPFVVCMRMLHSIPPLSPVLTARAGNQDGSAPAGGPIHLDPTGGRGLALQPKRVCGIGSYA